LVICKQVDNKGPLHQFVLTRTEQYCKQVDNQIPLHQFVLTRTEQYCKQVDNQGPLHQLVLTRTEQYCKPVDNQGPLHQLVLTRTEKHKFFLVNSNFNLTAFFVQITSCLTSTELLRLSQIQLLFYIIKQDIRIYILS